MSNSTPRTEPPANMHGSPEDHDLWFWLLLADSTAPKQAGEHFAVVIEALRDWLFLKTCHTTHALEVRDLLTEQARIARGEG